MVVASGAVALRIAPIPDSRKIMSLFHERLGSRIGAIYDADMHRELTGLIVSSERTMDASFQVFDSLGRFATTVGIVALLSSLVSLLLVLRTPPLQASAELVVDGNGG